MDNLNLLLNSYQQHTEQVLTAFQNQINQLRTSSANHTVLNKIQVESYGTWTALVNLASIRFEANNMMLVIRPYDKTLIKAIVNAINTAPVNLTAQDDAQTVFVKILGLTHEQKLTTVKQLERISEDYKAQVRAQRHKILKQFTSLETGLSDYEKNTFKKECETITTQVLTKINDLVSEKRLQIIPN